MKRGKTILIIVCLLGFVNLQAQFIKQFGVKAGVSIANQSFLFTPNAPLLVNNNCVLVWIFVPASQESV